MKIFGHGVLWDPARSRVAARFDRDGILETEDKRVIELAAQAGFTNETNEAGQGAQDEDEAGLVGEMTKTELFELCVAEGLEVKKGWTRAQLIEALEA